VQGRIRRGVRHDVREARQDRRPHRDSSHAVSERTARSGRAGPPLRARRDGDCRRWDHAARRLRGAGGGSRETDAALPRFLSLRGPAGASRAGLRDAHRAHAAQVGRGPVTLRSVSRR
jgi:hypothetical protein